MVIENKYLLSICENTILLCIVVVVEVEETSLKYWLVKCSVKKNLVDITPNTSVNENTNTLHMWADIIAHCTVVYHRVINNVSHRFVLF